jgi:hypothetical protein
VPQIATVGLVGGFRDDGGIGTQQVSLIRRQPSRFPGRIHPHRRARARPLAAETVKPESTRSDLVNQAYGLTPAQIALMWQIAPPRMPIPLPVV